MNLLSVLMRLPWGKLRNSIHMILSLSVLLTGGALLFLLMVTFLPGYNFSGKTIMPFITNEGLRMEISETNIKELCPNTVIAKGLPVRGGSVKMRVTIFKNG